MLINHFGLTIASYQSLDELRSRPRDEYISADIVTIREHIKEGIFHSVSSEWWRSIANVTKPEDIIRSKRERQSLQESISYFLENGYEIKTVPLTIERYEEFFELYKQTTLQKERALSFDISGKLLGQILAKKNINITGLFLDNKIESAVTHIFEDTNKVRVNFGAKKRFDNRGGVGGVLEAELIRFCIEHKVTEICHGIGSNPAGVYASSGIFEFKARYGFSAFPTGYWHSTLILNAKIALSDLVFVTTSDNQPCYVIVSKETDKDVKQKYITHEVKNVVQLNLDDTIKKHLSFIQTL